MKKQIFFACLLFLVFPLVCHAHTVNYAVEKQGVTVRVFYSENDPASYCEYEIYGPGMTFLIRRVEPTGTAVSVSCPIEKGSGRSRCGGNPSMASTAPMCRWRSGRASCLRDSRKPLVATHLKLFVGVSLIFGLFGIITLWRNWRGKKGKLILLLFLWVRSGSNPMERSKR